MPFTHTFGGFPYWDKGMMASSRGVIRFKSAIPDAALLCIEQSRILIKLAIDCGLAFETVGTKRRGREKSLPYAKREYIPQPSKELEAPLSQYNNRTDPSYLSWRRLYELFYTP